jgi:hypothetical protein
MDFRVTFSEPMVANMAVNFQESGGKISTSFGEIQTVSGKDGLSAYEIALNNGFVGSEKEWLESLNAADGEDGVSPVVEVEKIDGGHRLTITDKDGEKTFDVMDGVGGAGGGVTSWNDLEDRPFGEGEKIEWEKVTDGSNSQTGSITKIDIIPKPLLTLTPGKTYKLVVYAAMSGSRETIGVASKSTNIATGYNSYAIGSVDDAVRLTASAFVDEKITAFTIELAEPIQSFMGVLVTIYEEKREVKPLDEKYIPSTIARKNDIPEIPEVPTKVSKLENDAGFITAEDIPEVPSKVSELVNDVGFITADDIPEDSGGVTSWNDLTDKPFKEEPLFDIRWDGDTSGRFVLDMSKLGFDDGMFLVKVSDLVLSTKDIIGGKCIFDSWESPSIEEGDIDSSTFPGTHSIHGYIAVVYEQSAINSAIGLPDGYITNGTYFMLNESGFVSSFQSAMVEKIDEKYLPDSVATKSYVEELLGVIENGTY